MAIVSDFQDLEQRTTNLFTKKRGSSEPFFSKQVGVLPTPKPSPVRGLVASLH